MEKEALSDFPLTNMNDPKRLLRPQISAPSQGLGEGDEEKPAVRDLLVYYARHSTMHGIPSIVGYRLYKGRRVFWVVVVCCMAILLSFVIYWQMSDFYRYPTVTSVNVDYVTEQDFPAVTICDLNIFNENILRKSAKDTQIQMAYLTEITSIYHIVGRNVMNALLRNSGQVSRNVTGDSNVTEELIQRTKELVENTSGGLYCSWGDYYWEECGVALQTQVTEMGVCFTVDTRKLVKKTKGSTGEVNAIGNALRGLGIFVTTVTKDIPYRLFAFVGFKVVLHDHDEDPLPMSRGFLIDANTSVEIEIHKNVRIGLEPPFAAFGTGICVDVEKPDFVNPLKRFPHYTKEACETECFVDYVVASCGCRHFLHPGNETACSLAHLKNCYREEDGAEAKYYRARKKTQEACDCPMPCKQSIYNAGVSSASVHATSHLETGLRKLNISFEQAGIANLHFFFPDPVVTTIKQVPVYSLEGLLGSIGGQVGLFMGFSLITVAEMCELFFLLATRGRRLFLDEHRRPIGNGGHRN